MLNSKYIFSWASLVNGLSFSMILPLLAPLIRQLKLSEIQAGALVSVGAFLMALSAIKIAKKTTITNYHLMLIGFLGMSITWSLFSMGIFAGLYYPISSFLLFIILLLTRASTGIFMAMPQIALQTYVMTQYAEEKKRSQQMAFLGSLNSLGMIIGPFLTSFLLIWGLMTPLWIAIIFLCLMTFLIFIYLKPDQINLKEERSTKHNQEGPFQSFPIRHCIAWLLLGFSMYFAIVTLNLTAGFYIQDRFKTSVLDGAVYFAQCSILAGIAMVAMQISIAKLLHWSLRKLLWCGLISMILGLTISLLTDSLRVFQSVYLLFGIAIACLMPAFTTGTAQSGPKAVQNQLASWCTATQALGFVIGPLVSTGLYQLNKSLPYGLLIMIMLSLAVYFLIFYPKNKEYPLNVS